MTHVMAKTRLHSKLPHLVDLMLAKLGGTLPRELTGRTSCYHTWASCKGCTEVGLTSFA